MLNYQLAPPHRLYPHRVLQQAVQQVAVGQHTLHLFWHPDWLMPFKHCMPIWFLWWWLQTNPRMAKLTLTKLGLLRHCCEEHSNR